MDNMFPICSTLERLTGQLPKKRRLRGVSPEAITVIQSLQPYHDGKGSDATMLSVLDDLCNINKHRRVLLTNLSCGVRDMELKTVDGELFGRITRIEDHAKVGPFPIANISEGRVVKADMPPKTIGLYL
jgi:hypothetical protein